ncbi:alpha-galactosidase [Bifidobacterium oedipodis]|uniref:Alpha-galactosidase n=1 Tax=Bifidobacterium oedipodis TaxID=2675322 RepID=A0A7Y0HSW6_9BIFI|nr:alpha-galactosidase [Bifidobacterium sp. DSM 109957]NMM93019.1 alpha-galactosidase [Bifidobacterium sp. DSM 109957]
MSNQPRILVHDASEFHLTNGLVSYVIRANEQGKLLHLYYGAAVTDRDDFGYLVELQRRSTACCPVTGNLSYSLEHLRQECPEYGASDYRMPAVSIAQPNGSRLTNLTYAGYRIIDGKPALHGLPSSYVDDAADAATLEIDLVDTLINVTVTLTYTVFANLPVIARSSSIHNNGTAAVDIERVMSLSLDLPDDNYVTTQLTGSWARERSIVRHPLHPGIQQIGSLRGSASGHVHNPAVALARPNATESAGEVIGAALVYSGNFEAHVEVDAFAVSRLQMGIADFGFTWHLEPGEEFQAPEAVFAYTTEGYNGLSHAFHDLVRHHVVRGPWRDKERPVLINNWEATYFNFNEDKLVSIAAKAKDAGVELFVLDDGWFGERSGDTAGLGDWTPNKQRLPEGMGGLARRINDMGMLFGLWFEPEMVNMDSDLYRAHPDWVLHTPDRPMSHGRNQYVLNFANPDVVDNIFGQMHAVLSSANISYIKWDMNRYITEAYDVTRDERHQGEVFHRYILGMYELNQRLLEAFPDLIIEGCASGGGRFDLGMLCYSPQIWASDDTDAVERMSIQYGTSLFYPLASIGAHVSIVPNHQTNRLTTLNTRTNVAMFGTFGYELDLGTLTDEEFEQVKHDVAFFKQYRETIHTGDFYRLVSPFEIDPRRNGKTAWMVVSQDKRTAIVGDYAMLEHPMSPFSRLHLEGLDPQLEYQVEVIGGASTINGGIFHGDELMRVGMIDSDASTGSSSGEVDDANNLGDPHDFDSRLFVLTAR